MFASRCCQVPTAFVLMMVLYGASFTSVYAQSAPPPPAPPVEFSYTFENDPQGWTTGFADLPADYDQSFYELDSGHRELPSDLEGGGIYVQGHNHSDDLFMFLKKQVDGLNPGTRYRVIATIDLATNVPAGMVGIGGSPGESVYVKAGATAIEPVVEQDDTGHLRMNIDKGNQATEGTEMINLGNVAHPEVSGDEYGIKTLSNEGRPLEVTPDADGRVWLIAGTDSGFEGVTSVYYSRISHFFSPIEESPPTPPSTGDWTAPGWLLVGVAIMGGVLAKFGVLLLARQRYGII